MMKPLAAIVGPRPLTLGARLRRWLPAAAAVALVALGASCQVPTGPVTSTRADFYVAPNGNDAWTGRLPTRNYAGTDGPFATIERARDALRHLTRPRYPSLGRFVVLLRSGLYRIGKPLVFRPEDSGSPTAPIVYAAYPGERPVLSGARLLTGWTTGPAGVWTARVPEIRNVPAQTPRAPGDGRWHFHQLFVNGQRRTRARTPNTGTLRTEGPLPQFTPPQAHRQSPEAHLALRYKPGDLKAWPGLADVNLLVYHSWAASRQWIKQLDEAKHIVRFTAPCEWPLGYWEPTQRYIVENHREALDAPGEWYLDRKTRTLHYWPMPGENLTQATVEAPVLTELVRLEGDPDAGRYVHHLTLQGLTLLHTDWQLDPKQPTDGQAATFLATAAVVGRGTRQCAIDRCEIAHVGTHAIWLADGCSDNRIARSHLHDLGAGGVRIGTTTSATHQGRASDRNTIHHCYIHDGGHVFPAGVGIWIGRSCSNAVTHNEITQFSHTGISVGWSWGYAPSTANHNRIEHNHIHHLGNGMLNDLGGIYTLGVSPGTAIRHNRIHDIQSYSEGGWGLYTDEGSSQILIENNIVYNTRDGAFHQRTGRDNVIRNNIFAYSRGPQIVRSREEAHLSFTFERNIVYCNNDAVLAGTWRNNQYRFDRNLYWVTTGAQPDFARRDIAVWREAGQDLHSLIAAPRFVDPARYDFRLRIGSPARRVGYRPIDTTAIGLAGTLPWLPTAPTAPTAPSPPRPTAPPAHAPAPTVPQAVRDNFETTPEGHQPAHAVTGGELAGASIRVSKDTAASGHHSLKITDAAGLPNPTDPHLHYECRHGTGTVRFAFDIRLEPGATAWLEWRTDATQYLAGPSILLGANGQLVAGGKALMALPPRQWIHLDIVCPLGNAAAGTYNLTVGIPGTTRRFDGLPCASPSFRRLRWLGFMSLANAPAVYYLDNLQLDLLP